MNILAVGAHPDDLEILCGGTLALYAQKGHAVTMAILTNGNVGRPDTEKEAMARIRKNETLASAALIGAKVIWMDVDDEMSEINVEQRLNMVDVFREAKPDVVLTHSEKDYHVDHRNTSQLVFEAAPLACVHKIERELPELDKQPLIYHFDTLGGVGFMPYEYVDISSVIEMKKKMYNCHTSQVDWMREATGFDIDDVIETVAKMRGYAAGVQSAEGFIRVDAWYRGTVYRVLP